MNDKEELDVDAWFAFMRSDEPISDELSRLGCQYVETALAGHNGADVFDEEDDSIATGKQGIFNSMWPMLVRKGGKYIPGFSFSSAILVQNHGQTSASGT
ncbi:uncharacterized protein STEHIDRAFT_154868 [Stereum hirsutum FP-91666 SS1]|uniref:uncharacterized protein n=1 Tax=Stereum hirsutum (strain FP-91666) TaxID=721885 RepID=UPI000440CE02|nr:uncharacterized protein STEHIDRAFT_154868 [Stereum hirsutum FP-91666 SS1]EIM89188.1 hypothetical protein STEHIDRAFT_154868 [Stereum hirsutum FP-91666 SS1]